MWVGRRFVSIWAVGQRIDLGRRIREAVCMSDQDEQKDASGKSLAISKFSGLFHQRMSELTNDVLLLTEAELETKFRPTPADFFMRRNFWKKTEEAEAAGIEQIESASVYIGVVTRQYFYENILKNPLRLAWILSPIREHTQLIEEGFYFALKKVRDELLTMPVNEKTAPALMKAL